MIKKVLVMLCANVLLLLLMESCRCPEQDLPYYDFTTMNFTIIQDIDTKAEADNTIEASEEFLFWLAPDSLTFSAQKRTQFSLFPSAYATQPCPDDRGKDGLKQPIQNIQFSSDHDFNTLLANTSLNSLIEVGIYNTESGQFEFMPLTDLPDFSSLDFVIIYELFIGISPSNIFRFTQKPETIKEHTIKVEITKADGTTVMSEQPVTWE